MNDYYATIRIQQGRLKSAMLEREIETIAELARLTGFSQGSISRLLNFKDSPRKKNRKWRPVTIAVCKILGSEPDDIFPEHLDYEVATNRISAFVEHAQLSSRATQQLAPDAELEQSEMEHTIDEVLELLPEKQRRVLKSRFWDEKTLQEIGSDFKLDKECIRQHEARALRTLRHPFYLKKIKSVCPFNVD